MQRPTRSGALRALIPGAILAAVLLAGPAARAGQLSVSPSSVDFGSVEIVAPPLVQTVRLINHGSPTYVSAISSKYGCGEFLSMTSGLPVTLQDADTLTFQVSYDPTNWGPDICSFEVDDDNGVADIFGATGTGLATNLSVFENLLSYAQQPFTGGVPETLFVSVLNNGNEPITEGHLGLTFQTGVDFTMGTFAYPIASGETRELPVIFHPLTQGAKIDTLTLSLDNDLPIAPDVKVGLEGTWSDGPTAVGLKPGTATLLRIGPSPTQGASWVSFSAPQAGPVQLDVRDLAGRLVARRQLWASGTGVQRARLFGDADGAPAPGVYLVSVTHGGRLIGRGRVVVIR